MTTKKTTKRRTTTTKPKAATKPPVEVPPRPAGSKTIRIELPVCSVEDNPFLARHVDVQLDLQQRVGLRAVFNALSAHPPARLASGRYVQSIADAVRWVFEAIGDKIEPKTASKKP